MYLSFAAPLTKYPYRAVHFALIPWSPLMVTIDTVVGSVLGPLALLSGHVKIFERSSRFLNSTRLLVALPYKHLIGLINPNAPFPRNEYNSKPLVSAFGNGLLTHLVAEKLKMTALEHIHSGSCFRRHVASRLTYGLLLITSCITRVVDVVIGSIATVFSLLTLGKIGLLNNLAYRGLQITGLVHDLFFYTTKMMHPTSMSIILDGVHQFSQRQ